ncbi:hypothetical protein PENVUL_c125G09429, partial [Penicillium vulpinum]
DEETDEDPSIEQTRFEKSGEAYWRSLRDEANLKPIRTTPSRNQLHCFLYRGSLLALNRDPYHTQNSWLSDTETFTIYAPFWNRKVLFALLEEVQMKSQSIAVLLNGNNHLGFNYVELSSSIVNSGLPPNIKDGMIENIKEFLSPQSKAWYKFRGIPYRRGYLLYGPPGTGKSSICSAIAGHLWLDIYTISLNSRKLNDDMLNKFFQSLPKRCIVLFEDVDNAGIGQEVSQMKNTGRVEDSSQENELYSAGISLSAFLNCLDGVGAQEGRILIMTTNHPEKLDPALTRSGRVDQKYHFDFMDTICIKQLFHLFFSEESSFISPISEERESNDQSTREKRISDLSDKFVRIVSPNKLTAAEINNYLMGFKENPEKAVLKALDWVRHRKEAATPLRL